ncbi:MAG: GNAT family N-acetyltransferase [Halobacteriovoraceae bacterium]|jgi:[ribosomal protein S18]-alanine N-acetyltransferase|nr:GNAT family N-acetyltransferase [Halobacteriovoraceae bacterium]MBT5094809.1 GNAT family N-acetyltransferase [Halobacteriovoraceae bacterium]
MNYFSSAHPSLVIFSSCQNNWPDSNTLDQLVALDKGFNFPWSLDRWKDLDQQEHFILFLLLESEELTAMGLVYAPNLEQSELIKLTVQACYKRQGKGIKLLENVISYLSSIKAESLFLDVEETNLAALNLYRNLNFNELGVKQNFYGPGRNGISMRRSIDATQA